MQPISQNYRTMSYRNKLKIGEFSRLMQVTVKTLRHYEHKGLLIPDEIDEWTGYRYYNIEQMQKLSRIREMQRLGFSLDEIRDLFEDDRHTPHSGTAGRKDRQNRADAQGAVAASPQAAGLERLLK